MSLDFLSGLLLTTVVLAMIAYIVKELAADRAGDLKKAQRFLSDTLTKYVGNEAKPVNDHLIGSIGKVVAHSDVRARPMRVRLGLEFWSARTDRTEGRPLPVGASVKVTAVDGPILVVESTSDATAGPAVGTTDVERPRTPSLE
jgi:membrane protein implicated in regulation of membrane protease activity